MPRLVHGNFRIYHKYLSRVKHKHVRIGGIILGSILLLLLIGGYIAYAKREAILQREITKAILKAKHDYNLDVTIGSAHFTGLSNISFTDITVVPVQRDSLLSIKQFDVGVKLMPLIYGEVKLSDVTMKDGILNLTDQNGIKNFDFLFKHKKDTTNTKVDLAQLASNLINQVLYKIPDNLSVTNFLVSLSTDSSSFKMLTKTAVIENGQLSSTLDINKGAATWHFAGRMHPSDKDIAIKLYADGKKVELPYIERKYHMKVNFDTISTRLVKVERGGG